MLGVHPVVNSEPITDNLILRIALGKNVYIIINSMTQ